MPPITGEDQQDFLKSGRTRADGDRADLSDLPVAYADHRGAEDPQRRAGPEGVGAAAADDHPGQPRRVRPAGHAAAALRDVRLRGPARASRGLAVGRCRCTLGANPGSGPRRSTDEGPRPARAAAARWGFDMVELPIERSATGSVAGGGTCSRCTASAASMAVAWRPGVTCAAPTRPWWRTTQAYLRGVPGRRRRDRGAARNRRPVYTAVGRTWRMSPDERGACYAHAPRRARAGCRPRRRRSASAIGVEPLGALRDEPGQHGGAGAGADRRPARLRPPSNLPREHRGERR